MVVGDDDPQTGGDLVHLLAHVPASKAGQARLPLVLHLLLPEVSEQCADWTVRSLKMGHFLRFFRCVQAQYMIRGSIVLFSNHHSHCHSSSLADVSTQQSLEVI